jgi:SAM-dependent methyltransferase
VLDPRPTSRTLHEAYPPSYFTHRAPTIEGPPRGTVALARRALRNGYVNDRYGFGLRPALPRPIAAGALRAAPRRRADVDRSYRHLRLSQRLLDVGCGNGTFVAAAGSAGWEAVGIDVDAAAVGSGRSHGLDLRVELLTDHAEVHPSSYDAMTMSHVLEHVGDPVGLLRSAYRSLRPGGALWIATPNLDSLGHAVFGPAWTGLDLPRHLVLFNGPALDEALRRAGFSNRSTVLPPDRAEPVYAWSAAIASGRLPAHGCDPPVTARVRLRAALADRRARRRPELAEELVVLVTKPTAGRPEDGQVAEADDRARS